VAAAPCASPGSSSFTAPEPEGATRLNIMPNFQNQRPIRAAPLFASLHSRSPPAADSRFRRSRQRRRCAADAAADACSEIFNADKRRRVPQTRANRRVQVDACRRRVRQPPSRLPLASLIVALSRPRRCARRPDR
jgi:hypothetical protein